MKLSSAPLLLLAACGTPKEYYEDKDLDGYGDTRGSVVTIQSANCDKDEVSAIVSGTFSDTRKIDCMSKDEAKGKRTVTLEKGDCNDKDAAVHPKATDAINGKDDDCDGVKDLSPAPTGLPPLHERYKNQGQWQMGEQGREWGSLVSDLVENHLDVTSLRPHALMPADLAALTPEKKEAAYNWALPLVQFVAGNLNEYDKSRLSEQLTVARDYAAKFNLESEQGYLSTLRRMDCGDVFAGRYSSGSSSTCEQFFVYMGPEDNWRGAIRDAKAKGHYDFWDRVEQGEFKAAPNRELETTLYRRVAAGELTVDELRSWTARAYSDLMPVINR